ncbi:MAG TPA: hypothetical protein VKA67_01360, partial [Verrucomicrobiae bacterium]|nr:hypothetical protein [Verrucomicrobiae bacterium]
TDGSVILLGTSEFSGGAASGAYPPVSHSIIVGRFTLVSSKVIEVQHRCETTRSTDGFGVASNLATEIYTVVEMTKES